MARKLISGVDFEDGRKRRRKVFRRCPVFVSHNGCGQPAALGLGAKRRDIGKCFFSYVVSFTLSGRPFWRREASRLSGRLRCARLGHSFAGHRALARSQHAQPGPSQGADSIGPLFSLSRLSHSSRFCHCPLTQGMVALSFRPPPKDRSPSRGSRHGRHCRARRKRPGRRLYLLSFPLPFSARSCSLNSGKG